MKGVIGKSMGKIKIEEKKKRSKVKYECKMGHKRTYKFSQDWSYKKHMRMHHLVLNADELLKRRGFSNMNFK